MESKEQSEADKYFAKIKDVDSLGGLKRRPRCPDGSLDLRAKANKSFSKHGNVTDFYFKQNPLFLVSQDTIDGLLKEQQEEYDKLRFKELVAQKTKLEKKEQLRKEQQKEEVEALGEYCAKLGKIHRKYQDLIKQL